MWMTVVVSGSSGLIGSAVIPALKAAGHRVSRLVRSKTAAGEGAIYWNPAAGELNTAALEGTDAVIHLSGESIAQRWNAETKARIVSSRVSSTRLLAESLGRLKRPPEVFISASAVGYYGDRGEELLHEDSVPGSGFLAECCHAWETAAQLGEQYGMRTVRLRFGVLLSTAGGALPRMLPPFRFGVGGKVGSGKQYMSWIAIDDAVGAILHAVHNTDLRGAVNAVGPNPVTNEEFTKTLGKVLHRPAVLPLPAFVVRLAFGEMGEELLLSSTRVQPAKLRSSGYVFRYPTLEPCLRALLG